MLDKFDHPSDYVFGKSLVQSNGHRKLRREVSQPCSGGEENTAIPISWTMCHLSPKPLRGDMKLL